MKRIFFIINLFFMIFFIKCNRITNDHNSISLEPLENITKKVEGTYIGTLTLDNDLLNRNYKAQIIVNKVDDNHVDIFLSPDKKDSLPTKRVKINQKDYIIGGRNKHITFSFNVYDNTLILFIKDTNNKDLGSEIAEFKGKRISDQTSLVNLENYLEE